MRKNKYIIIFSIKLFLILTSVFLLKHIHKGDSEKINIILISIDSLRPDHLGCYGYNRDTSPNIDKLSKEGVIFAQAISAGGWTTESVPSILTGTYSFVHKIFDSINLINPNVKTLANELRSAGYKTVIYSNHTALKYLDIKKDFTEKYIEQELDNYQPTITDYALTTKIQTWLKNNKNTPFFLYVHYWGCHHPYRPPAEYKNKYLFDNCKKTTEIVPISEDSREDGKFDGWDKIPYIVAENNVTDPAYYIAQYDAVISYIDAQVGRLVNSLKDLMLDKNTVIILTADHGEMLGEHKLYFLHGGLYEEDIRVPLIIKFPNPAGKIIANQVNLIDIAPTILEIGGLIKPSYMQGESLLSFIRPFRVYSSKYALSTDREYVSVRLRDWKLIYNSNSHRYELYNLKKDHKEKYNLADKRRDKIRRLGKKIQKWKEARTDYYSMKQEDSLSEKDKNILRSFGYIQ